MMTEGFYEIKNTLVELGYSQNTAKSRQLIHNAIKNALIEPYNQIQSNGEVDITDDIIDPAEVIYYAVEHACSVIAELVTVDVITPEIELALPEEGSFAIAKVKAEELKFKMKEKGLWNENEEEAWNDNFGGLTENEYNETFEQD